MRTQHIQVLVSKYHSPLRGTRDIWRKSTAEWQSMRHLERLVSEIKDMAQKSM